MKLHLPLSLRAALLACFAAFAPAAYAADLTWDTANSQWAEDALFSDGQAFTQGDNVTFDAITDGDAEGVSLVGALQVGEMTVNAGEGKTYKFTGSGSITSLESLTVASGTAEFDSAKCLPTGAAVQVDAGAKLQLDYDENVTNVFNLNITLGGKEGAASGAILELNGTPRLHSFTLNGSLSMEGGSVLQLNGEMLAVYNLDSNLMIAEGATATLNTLEQSHLYLNGSSSPAGTLRLEGTASMLYLKGAGTYNLDVANGSMVSLSTSGVHANVQVEDGKNALLQFYASNTSANLNTGKGGEIWVRANSDATVNQLSGSGTLVVGAGNLLLEDAAGFSGTIRLQSGSCISADGALLSGAYGDATLIMGSSEAALQATVELGTYRNYTYSLALADGVDSAELKSLTGSSSSRIQAGNYCVREGGSFAGTFEDGVTLTVGAGYTMNFAGARADDGASATLIGEGGSTLEKLTLGSGMALGADLEDDARPVTLQDFTGSAGSSIKAGNYRVLGEDSSFAGTLEDGVTLTVGAGSTMDFDGARADDGASVTLIGEGGSTLANLTLGSGMVLGADFEDAAQQVTLQGFAGSAESSILAGNYRVLGDSSFAGTLEDGVTLTVGAGSRMDFAGADLARATLIGEDGSTLTNLTLGSGMVLGADFAGTAQSVMLQNLTLEGGSAILFDAQSLTANSAIYDMSGASILDTGDGGSVLLVVDGAENLTAGDSYLLLGDVEGLLQDADPEEVFEVVADESRGAHLQYSLDAQSGDLVLTLTPVADYYRRAAGSHNGQAGAAMIDALFVASQPQFNAPGSDAAALLQELDRLIEGGNAAAADNVMAAAAGASVTTLGMAFAADAQHRLNNIRDRVSTLKLDAVGAPAGDPGPDGREPLSFWVNAEGGYLTLEQSGTAPGYSMTSWGGTVGVEGSPRRDLSCGLAFSAIFSDLDADAADGDLNAYYISAFGQYRRGAWKHTLVASLGLADMSLDRTVSHGAGSYRTSGETDGLSLGFLYELSRDIALNGERTAVLQPLVNVSYLHTRIDGYTEGGSDAALRFGGQDLDSVSFGAGARVQALAGESLLNRHALFEGRVLAKFNAGDRRSTAGVGFANGFGQATVESATIGVFGVELGGGVTLPLGREAGSIFVDVSYELYREYSSLNAGVGYRLSF